MTVVEIVEVGKALFLGRLKKNRLHEIGYSSFLTIKTSYVKEGTMTIISVTMENAQFPKNITELKSYPVNSSHNLVRCQKHVICGSFQNLAG